MSKCTRVAAAALVLSVLTTPSSDASPITITQTFDLASQDFLVNGVLQTVTGNWVFTINTDSANPDLSPLSDRGQFATSSITVSNTGLGLVNVGVTSHTFYFELQDFFGYWSGITGGLFPFLNSTALRDNDPVIGDPNVIEPGLLDFTADQNSFWVFGDQGDLLILANGMTIGYAGSFAFASQSSATSAPAPEPTSLVLLGTALIGGGVRRYRQRRSKQYAFTLSDV